MKFLRALFGNPGLKLLAVIIAFTLWLAVTKDLRQRKTIWLPLSVVLEDAEHYRASPLGLRPDGKIQVEVDGPKLEVEIFSRNVAGAAVAKLSGADQLGSTSTGRRVGFGLEDLDFSSVEQGRDLVVRRLLNPSPVWVRIERMITKSVPVQNPELKGTVDFENTLFELQGRPPDQRIRGLQELLKDVTKIETFVPKKKLAELVDQMGGQTRQTFTVPLEPAPTTPQDMEFLEPGKLVVQIEVRRQNSATLWVPIHIVYTSPESRLLRIAKTNELKKWFRRGTDTEQARVQLEFKGSPGAIKRLGDDQEKIVAFVRADELDAAVSAGSVRLRLQYLSVPAGITCKLDEYDIVIEEPL